MLLDGLAHEGDAGLGQREHRDAGAVVDGLVDVAVAAQEGMQRQHILQDVVDDLTAHDQGRSVLSSISLSRSSASRHIRFLKSRARCSAS